MTLCFLKSQIKNSFVPILYIFHGSCWKRMYVCVLWMNMYIETHVNKPTQGYFLTWNSQIHGQIARNCSKMRVGVTCSWMLLLQGTSKFLVANLGKNTYLFKKMCILFIVKYQPSHCISIFFLHARNLLTFACLFLYLLKFI